MPSSKSCIDTNDLSDSLTRHLVDELDEIIFVCDPDSYELLYLNDFRQKNLQNRILFRKKCHEPCSAIQGPVRSARRNI